jgi:hypothetical protein
MRRDKAFQKLQAEWYAKLKETGFTDIEASGRLPEIDYRNATIRDREAIQAYFTVAGAYVHSGHFEQNEHLDVWLLHAEGLSVREIAAKLDIDRNAVHAVIKEHRRRAKLR